MKKLAIVALALALPVAATAEVHHFAVDPVHSQVGFKARHLVATTPGRFDDFTGSIWLDPDNIAGTFKLEATVQSVEFKDGLYYVVGDLTMRGVTKEVALEAEYNGITTNPFTGTPTIGMEFEGKVNRKDFGMEWNKTLDAGGVVLGDEIKIVVSVEATVPPAKS